MQSAANVLQTPPPFPQVCMYVVHVCTHLHVYMHEWEQSKGILLQTPPCILWVYVYIHTYVYTCILHTVCCVFIYIRPPTDLSYKSCIHIYTYIHMYIYVSICTLDGSTRSIGLKGLVDLFFVFCRSKSGDRDRDCMCVGVHVQVYVGKYVCICMH